jgi:CxxC motif-containing protein (DUF1111 family)
MHRKLFLMVRLFSALSGLFMMSLALSDDDVRGALLAHEVTADLGGATTVNNAGPQAFREIAANAAGMSHARFMFGKQLFETVWEPAPGSQPTTDGLGPVFNRSACSECHINNGRGAPPDSVDATMDSMLIRLSSPGQNLHGGPKPVAVYGEQLQDRGIQGVPPEGRGQITYTEVAGEFNDGSQYSLRQPALKIIELEYGELPGDTLTSMRVASPMIGLGLLEAVPEEVLYALADTSDADGISGRVNIVWDAVNEKEAVGRFGWKANMPNLRQQNAGAALGDMGITTSVFSDDLCEPEQAACIAAADAVADPPELQGSFFDPLVRYTQLIAVPRQRNAESPEVQGGFVVFRESGCAACHMPTLKTGESEIAEVAKQVIHPFSDLLLHDMGPGLADGRPDFLASGNEWRTAPLWGIGLTETVGGFKSFMHDGRARNLTEAILWHGGEAAGAQANFRRLPASKRDALITFLESL